MRALAPLALVLVAACGGSPPPPVAPGPSTDKPVAKAEAKPDAAATKAAALEKLTAGEAKSGTCDEGHKAALEKHLAALEETLRAKKTDDGKPLGLEVVGKRVVALGASSKSVELSVTGRGTELHVMAFGARDVSMDVLVGNQAASTLRSPHQRAGASSIDVPNVGAVELQSDSRQTEIKPGQPLVVKLSGEGCAAMISLLRK